MFTIVKSTSKYALENSVTFLRICMAVYIRWLAIQNALSGSSGCDRYCSPVSYTHLTLPTPPYV